MIFQARAILFLARHVKFLDGNGELVDWQPETGDGGPVDEFLQPSVEQRQLALDEALTITGTGVDDRDSQTDV